jgi:shikimate kinase
MENRTIFLIGFMGCGKSAVGAEMRKEGGLRHAETDRIIEKEAGKTISRIFEEDGEAHFRALESGLLKKFRGQKDLVVSCGGGTAMRPENVEEMRSQGVIVWLTASPEVIYERVKRSHHRPLLEGNMNPEYISSLLEKRLPAYERAADIRVSTDHRKTEEICQEILQKILEISEK